MDKRVSYFFVRFPTCLIASGYISHNAQSLLLYLMRCEIQKWHPTFGQIAKAIRAGNDTVGRTLIELELLGIIEIWRGKKHRVGKSLKKEKNIYEINWDISKWRPTPKLKQRLIEDCRNLGLAEPVFKREFKSDEEHRAIFSKICRKKARNKNAQGKDQSEFSEAEKSWFSLVDNENPQSAAIQVFELLSENRLNQEHRTFMENIRDRLVDRLNRQVKENAPTKERDYLLLSILKKPTSVSETLLEIRNLKP